MNYFGYRATIIAFNKDAGASLMTLNKRHARPKVVPILGTYSKPCRNSRRY
jgi:hypothetical protein